MTTNDGADAPNAADIPNAAMVARWTGEAGRWIESESQIDRTFAPATDAVLTAAALVPDDRVLDIGCGTGSLLAASAEFGVDCVGVDLSPGMAAAAARRVPTATVVVADAQVADLTTIAPGAPYTVVLSRFGVMFFDDPVTAFANIRRACAADARLAFVCWRSVIENPMFSLGFGPLDAAIDPPAVPPTDGVPGPVGFAAKERIEQVLGDSGWAAIAVTPLDVRLSFANDHSDGVAERLVFMLGSATGRAAHEQVVARHGAAAWDDLLATVRQRLLDARVDGELAFPGALWQVTARSS